MLENAELWKMHNIQFHLRCAATVLENAAEDGQVWEVDGGGGPGSLERIYQRGRR